MTKSSIFTQRVVAARTMRDLNQEELSKRSGLTPAAVSHFETGARKPSFDNLRKLAEALEVTSDYLMGRSEDPEGVADVNIAYRDGMKGLSSDQREMTLNFIEMLKKQSSKK